MTRQVRVAKAFLVLLLAVALLQVEWWPLTAWRLFSNVRTSTQAGWDVVTVDGSQESAFPFGALPRGYRSYDRVLAHTRSAPERDRVCASWSHAARDLGREFDALRIYRVSVRFARPGRPATFTRRALAFECPP